MMQYLLIWNVYSTIQLKDNAWPFYRPKQENYKEFQAATVENYLYQCN